jgi:hypothetical protein
MKHPYDPQVKVSVVTYRIEVYHEGFVFSVYVSDYQYKFIIENIRILDDKDEWRRTKYSIKNKITDAVEKITNEWIRSIQSPGH